MTRLESELLLRFVSRTCLRVPMPTPQELDDLCEAPATIDDVSARAAAARPSPGELTALRVTHERMTAAAATGDAAGLIRGHIRLHQQLVEASHTQRLANLSRPLLDAAQVLATHIGHSRIEEMSL